MTENTAYNAPTLTDLGEVVELTLGEVEFDPDEINLKRMTTDM
jgi:hypothetical protein